MKSWMVHYLEDGYFERLGGWTDVTGQMGREWASGRCGLLPVVLGGVTQL